MMRLSLIKFFFFAAKKTYFFFAAKNKSIFFLIPNQKCTRNYKQNVRNILQNVILLP